MDNDKDLLVRSNKEDFKAAGILNSLEVVSHIGISLTYAEQLVAGSKPISAPIRAKLDALIAAKANGPEPAEQFEVDLAVGPILTRFNNHTAARKICNKLNGEKG